ncbi:MAG: AI-2E family transporter [Alphaproteobacteria bacterium]|nr:AI-2E family transporter [Alphaproteobacteria bacterium]
MRGERHIWFWLGAFVLLILLIALIKDILLPFVVGIVLAYFLNPIADRLSALGLNRVFSSALIVGGVAALVTAAIVLLAPLLFAQAQQLAAALPGEISRFTDLFEAWARARLGDRYPEVEQGLAKSSQTMAENVSGLVGWLATALWDRSLAIFNFMTLLLVTPVVMFYVLVDWYPMLNKIDGWLPRDQADTIRQLASDVNDAVAAFIRGQGTVCLILGTFYALALSLLGLKYGLLVGVITGILTFIPFVGWATGIITATTLAVIQYWPEMMPIVLVAGVFGVGQALDAAYLSPTIVGSKVGLHPVWLIFSLFVFSYLFGLVGVLIAVPLAAALGVVVRFLLKAYLGSSFYKGAKSSTGMTAKQKAVARHE